MKILLINSHQDFMGKKHYSYKLYEKFSDKKLTTINLYDMVLFIRKIIK